MKQQHILIVKDRGEYAYIEVGGNKKKCVEIFVYPKQKRGKLQQIDYNMRCNTNENMTKGTRDLICASLYAVRKLYPNIKYLTLEDASLIQCDNKKDIKLANYYQENCTKN